MHHWLFPFFTPLVVWFKLVMFLLNYQGNALNFVIDVHSSKNNISFLSFYQDAEKLVGFDTEAQNLVHCLQVLEVLVSTLHTELLSKVTYIASFGLFTSIHVFLSFVSLVSTQQIVARINETRYRNRKTKQQKTFSDLSGYVETTLWSIDETTIVDFVAKSLTPFWSDIKSTWACFSRPFAASRSRGTKPSCWTEQGKHWDKTNKRWRSFKKGFFVCLSHCVSWAPAW